MRSIKAIEQQQLRARLDRGASEDWPARPRGGWIRAVRKALGMSGTALSRRLGGTRSMAASLEQYERDGAISLNRLQKVAEAMGCRLVYAIVPPKGQTIEALVQAQADQRAKALLASAEGHMALEAQSLTAADARAERERLAKDLVQKPPRDFWDAEQ